MVSGAPAHLVPTRPLAGPSIELTLGLCRSRLGGVITGHNTDVEFAGRIYHVQTEDRGQAHPVIETLVYTKGEILDSRKTPYAEVFKNGRDEKVLMRMMEQQHRRMVREVRNGRYDPGGPRPFGHNLLSNRTLDEVIREWLAADRAGEGLNIDLSSWYSFDEGAETTVEVSVRASGGEKAPIPGAEVAVRLVEGTKPPVELFRGTTGETGSVDTKFSIPDLKGAQAAIVFFVSRDPLTAELTRPILPAH